MVVSRLMRQEWFPQPHNVQHAYGHGLETGVVNQATIYPLLMYDEGVGTPSAIETHPENAAFAESAEPNCAVGSKVDFLIAEVRFSLTKLALVTDGLTAVRGAYMPIFMSFLENYTAIDEKSTLDISEVLEMQTESTDRQGYPLYNAVDMPVMFGTSTTMGANLPGLT